MNVTPATNVEYNEAVFESDLNSNAKLLALAIGKRYNWVDRRDCWPSNDTLSKMTGLSIATITRVKKILVEGGWITSFRRYDSTNIYTPTVPSDDWVYAETAVEPVEEILVSEEPEVITAPENSTGQQDEAVLDQETYDRIVSEHDDFGDTSLEEELEAASVVTHCDETVTEEPVEISGGVSEEIASILESEEATKLYLDPTFRANRNEDDATRARYANDYSYVPVAVKVTTTDSEEW